MACTAMAEAVAKLTHNLVGAAHCYIHFLPLSVVGISDIMVGNDGGLVNRNITFTAFGEPAVFSVGIGCLTLIL